MSADDLVAEWLRKIRTVMYAETLKGAHYSTSEPFFRDVKLLKQAVTWPAKECQDRGWQVPKEIFTQLITKTLLKISGNATVPFKEMRRRAAYFFHALQDEFRHNWDQYWDDTKSARNAAEVAAAELTRRRGQIQSAPIDDTQAVLAQAHALIKAPGGRPKKAKPSPKTLAKPEIQSELF